MAKKCSQARNALGRATAQKWAVLKVSLTLRVAEQRNLLVQLRENNCLLVLTAGTLFDPAMTATSGIELLLKSGDLAEAERGEVQEGDDRDQQGAFH